MLALHGADAYIEAVVLSYEHGVQKPDPAIFRIACAELGVAARRYALMIGDNPDADGAATRIGMRFVQVPPHPDGRQGGEFAAALGMDVR